MDKLVLDHVVPKQAEGTYYTLGFTVPDGLERLTVSYSYRRLRGKGGAVNIVDLGLMDGTGRFLGWSGSARDSVFVGPFAATNGYLMTDIRPGEWRILVGAYKIPDEGLPVRYEVTFTPRAPRWLTGDLHMHSDASDGQHDICMLTKMARKKGLDFIAVSNHNNYSENLHLPVVAGLTLIPAVEWTHYRGHMNFFGVADPFDNSFVANDEREMLQVVNDAKAKGTRISVNHPKDRLCPYLWQNDDCFDLIEVWNGPMRPANIKAAAWWHGMLMAGRKIPVVGGSDYHRDRRIVRFARPVTRVFSASPSVDDILDAISKGRCYVSASVSGVRLDLRYGAAGMGDTIDAKEGMALAVSAQRLRPGMRLALVTSDGVAARWRAGDGKVEQTVPVAASWRFAYLKVTRDLFGIEVLRAISNPIYFNNGGQ